MEYVAEGKGHPNRGQHRRLASHPSDTSHTRTACPDLGWIVWYSYSLVLSVGEFPGPAGELTRMECVDGAGRGRRWTCTIRHTIPPPAPFDRDGPPISVSLRPSPAPPVRANPALSHLE